MKTEQNGLQRCSAVESKRPVVAATGLFFGLVLHACMKHCLIMHTRIMIATVNVAYMHV